MYKLTIQVLSMDNDSFRYFLQSTLWRLRILCCRCKYFEYIIPNCIRRDWNRGGLLFPILEVDTPLRFRTSGNRRIFIRKYWLSGLLPIFYFSHFVSTGDGEREGHINFWMWIRFTITKISEIIMNWVVQLQFPRFHRKFQKKIVSERRANTLNIIDPVQLLCEREREIERDSILWSP